MRPVVIIGFARVAAVAAVSSAAQRAMAPFKPPQAASPASSSFAMAARTVVSSSSRRICSATRAPLPHSACLARHVWTPSRRAPAPGPQGALRLLVRLDEHERRPLGIERHRQPVDEMPAAGAVRADVHGAGHTSLVTPAAVSAATFSSLAGSHGASRATSSASGRCYRRGRRSRGRPRADDRPHHVPARVVHEPRPRRRRLPRHPGARRVDGAHLGRRLLDPRQPRQPATA